MKKNTIVEIIAALLILLFVYTGVSKFLTIDRFIHVLGESPLIGKVSSLIAWVLPITELFIAGLLFIPRTRSIGLYSSFILMLIFTIYLGYMLAFTPNLPCSCGGVLQQMSWPQHFIFNIFFTMLALSGIWLSRRKGRQKQDHGPTVVIT